MKFLTLARLPFNLIEHPEFHKVIQMARSAPSIPYIPSRKTIQRWLQTSVEESQQNLLWTLPPGAKISITLDCWTSPFSQAFMAVTGYFIDADWEYQEILLGFEPLHGSHTGANLSKVLLDILQRHQITSCIFALTTDNASNNTTLVENLQQSLLEDTGLIRVPCLAYVIQLSLNELLGKIRAEPKNDTTETKWTEKRS